MEDAKSEALVRLALRRRQDLARLAWRRRVWSKGARAAVPEEVPPRTAPFALAWRVPSSGKLLRLAGPLLDLTRAHAAVFPAVSAGTRFLVCSKGATIGFA